MNRVAEKTDQVLAWVAGVLFAALFLITVLNIVLRNLGGIAWLWIPTMIKFLFIWTIFTGTAVLYNRNDHLVMDYFSSKLAPRRKRVLGIVMNIVFLAFLGVLVVYGVIVVQIRMGIPFEMWRLPTGYAYLAVPVSGILMSFFCVNKLSRLVKGETDE